jgi:hypothetical protein
MSKQKRFKSFISNNTPYYNRQMHLLTANTTFLFCRTQQLQLSSITARY